MTYEENVKRFEDLLLSTKREGIEELLSWIRKSSFYKDPASSRFHNCHEHGLIEHSLNVYDCLKNKCNNPTWADKINDIGEDSIIISSLLHDICKIGAYKIEYRNKKVYSENGTKHDEAGRFDWQSIQGYTPDDNTPLGHGEKSVIMVQNFIKLKKEELYMIRWHMGFSESKDNYGYLSKAMREYPLIVAIHSADLEATYLLEEEE